MAQRSGGIEKRGNRLRRMLVRSIGPGLITGAADDDPAGITTYSQAGAAYQYGLLWTALLQIPLMIGVQLTCARIGLVSGRDLAAVLRRHYPLWILWCVAILLLIANTVTAAADIAGVAAGAALLTHVAASFFVPIVALTIVAVLVFGSFALLERILKWLTIALFGYLLAGVLARPDWGEVLRRTVVPGIRPSMAYLSLFVSVFGTTISPYLFVWQSGEEVDDMRTAGPGGRARGLDARRRMGVRRLRDSALDTITGMTASQVIGYFIIIAAGATLYPSGHRSIGTAGEAALALQPVGGGIGTVLFALGMIGTGLLAVPTLSGASAFAIAALAREPAGMSRDWRHAKAFYGVVAASTIVAGGVALTGTSPIELLLGSAFLNGLLAPPLLVVVLLVANNRAIMREHRNGWTLNVLVVLSAAIMAGASIWLGLWWIIPRL